MAVPPKRPVKHVDDLREAEIEAYGGQVVKYVFEGIPYKFVSPQRRSVPDRLCLFAVDPEHREIVARYVRFVEYKKHKVAPSTEQLREHEMLQGMGFAVDVIDSPAGVEEAFLGPFTPHRKIREWAPGTTATKVKKSKRKQKFAFLKTG